MYQDSAQMKQQSHGILNAIIARERNNSDAISKRNAHTIYTISAIVIAISIFCIFYFKKKHLQHKAEKKEWEEKLQAEIAQANLRKQELAEKYKTSMLYLKVSRIAKDLSQKEAEENLDEEEWNQFIVLTNIGWHGIITCLDEKRHLSAEEIKICCLYLAQVPVMHMGHFLHIQSRSTVQAKSKDILLK